MSWKDRHVLVTGGGGFIGSHVADTLLARGAQGDGVRQLLTGLREFVAGEGKARRGVTCSTRRSLDEAMRGVDFVFHLAPTPTSRTTSGRRASASSRTSWSPRTCSRRCGRPGTKEIAFASTGSVYGDGDRFPPRRTHRFPCRPPSTRVQSRRRGPADVVRPDRAPAPASALGSSASCRCLGPRYTHGHVFDFWRKLKADPTRLVVLGDGGQEKSYLHVADCVGAMMLAIEKRQGPHQHLQPGSLGSPEGGRQRRHHLADHEGVASHRAHRRRARMARRRTGGSSSTRRASAPWAGRRRRPSSRASSRRWNSSSPTPPSSSD